MTGTAMSSTAISTSGFTSGIDLFNVADQRMAWLNTRQSVLAQNITPTRTSAMHLQGTATGASGAHIVRGENAPDGNAVAIDEQMIKVAQTETDHQTATAIYGKYLGMFRMALGH